MRFIGALYFYTKCIEKLHVNLKPFYDLLNENTPWNWTSEYERLFQTLTTSPTSYTKLTIPKTKHPCFNTRAVLITRSPISTQRCKQNKFFVTLESLFHKKNSYPRSWTSQFCKRIRNEFDNIWSPHPIHDFTDHTPLLHCFTKKDKPNPQFYRAQMQFWHNSSKSKSFTHLEKFFLSLICSVVPLQKLNYNLTKINTNNFLHTMTP